MDIRRVKIHDPLSRVALEFDAVMVTLSGRHVTAHVTIDAGALRGQMIRASYNRSRQSVGGALNVKLQRIPEVRRAL